jgi:hypothetical protein
MRITGSYTPTNWEEKTIEIIEEHSKLTKVRAEFKFEGDIEGIAKVEYLMFYSAFDLDDMHKAQAHYVGQIRIIGNLNGKSGSFVANDSGTFMDGIAQSNLVIIAESGTGELDTITGVGEYSASQTGSQWEFEITL